MGVQAWRYTPYKLSARQIKWERRDYQAAGGKTAFYTDIHILESIARLYSVFHTLLHSGCFFLFRNTLTNVSFHTSFQQIHVSIHVTLFPSGRKKMSAFTFSQHWILQESIIFFQPQYSMPDSLHEGKMNNTIKITNCDSFITIWIVSGQ